MGWSASIQPVDSFSGQVRVNFAKNIDTAASAIDWTRGFGFCVLQLLKASAGKIMYRLRRIRKTQQLFGLLCVTGCDLVRRAAVS
jgi:hypothetical protein